MEIKNTISHKEKGFALLITLIVVGVVLSVGMTILDLSIKQVKLSTNARESEVAFHAANAGAECARYIRRDNSDDMVLGNQISADCFGVGSQNVSGVSIADVTGDGEVFQYEYEFEWGASTRCTQINTIVASSTLGGTGLTINQMPTLVPGYPNSTSNCDAGSQCTIMAVRGYNRSCSTANGYGSVQREVLLQF